MCMFGGGAPKAPEPPPPPPSQSDAEVAAAALAERQRRARARGRAAMILTEPMEAPMPPTGNAKKLLGD